MASVLTDKGETRVFVGTVANPVFRAISVSGIPLFLSSYTMRIRSDCEIFFGLALAALMGIIAAPALTNRKSSPETATLSELISATLR